MAAAVSTQSTFDVDKLSYEIFSILENKFLFGGYDDPKDLKAAVDRDDQEVFSGIGSNGRVRVLSIDGGGAGSGVLAAKALSHLETCLRRKSGNSSASISDYFDVVAGSGCGGVLAALLFTRGKDGRPLFTADEALRFMIENRRKLNRSAAPRGIFRRFSGGKIEKLLRSAFGESTLKDTIKSVLIPCYDLATRAPFVFSRADALEVDSFDFKMSDVCLATTGAVELSSVDKKTKICAVDGGIAMNNPTTAAITHVLNNKQEFPLCNGVEDLLVVSLGGGGESENLNSSPAQFALIAGEGASDTVDQAVSMAFGQCRESNYVRIQANGAIPNEKQTKETEVIAFAEKMLNQKNIESVLFKGKKLGERTNVQKLEAFSGELIKEQERRKTSVLPIVALKQTSSPSPRTSSATTMSSLSSC